MPDPVAITGIAVMTGLGLAPDDHRQAIDAGRHGLRPLGEFDRDSPYPDLPAGWIRPRGVMAGNRYGPVSNFAVRLACDAIADAGWTADEVRDCWLFVGTSRGNAAGSLAPWPGRRGHRQMATSNSMHSEIAAAVSIAYNIRGPYQVLSNGCASGLDAIGFGCQAVAAGMSRRALVVSADLPLLPPLLESYRQTGLLSKNGINDPYATATTGFLPAEGGAALALDAAGVGSAYAYLHGYRANSDAFHPLGLPANGEGIADCLRQAIAPFGRQAVRAICPHASGTLAHGQAEQQALRAVFAGARPATVSLHLLKPFTGHAIGASGAIDAAILAHYLRDSELPPNLPGLTGPGGPFSLPESPCRCREGIVLKISVGMGGHNAVIALSRQRNP